MKKCNVSSLPPQNYWPELHSNKPALKSKKLSDWWKLLKQNGTKCILVIHENQIVFERYAKDHDRYTPHYTASLAKALTGGMSLLFAIQDGLIKFDDPVWKYVSQWKNDPIKSQITVLHLATHTSGLEDSSVDGFQHTTEPGIKGEFWKRNPVPQDPFTISRDKIPVTFKPGHKYQYSNPGIAMLAYCVTKALQKSPHKDIRTLLKFRLMDPIEVPRSEWKCGYDQTFIVDDLPLVGTWGGGKYSARANCIYHTSPPA